MKRSHLHIPLWLFPVAFIAFVVVVGVGAFLVIAFLTPASIGAIDLNSQDLKVRLDELKATLQLPVVTAGLFVIAQGASAFFNATTVLISEGRPGVGGGLSSISPCCRG